MPKTIAYIMMHYGAEYLEYVIRAMHPFVQKIMIFYSAIPTHGTNVGIPCPEHRGDLLQIAKRASNKIEWIDINTDPKNLVIGENRHRRLIYKYTQGYDLILNADTDEVWDMDYLPKALDEAIHTDSRNIGILGSVNFYRSFNWTVYDQFAPIRIHNLRSEKVKQIDIRSRMYHFGYCQREEMIRYKIRIHGHQHEFKKGWLQEKYLDFDPMKTTHMHPCSETVWTKAQPFDRTTLPDMLKEHPYYNLEKV